MKRADKVRVCVPVCARRASEMREAAARASASADVVELRLDSLEEGQLGRATGMIQELVAQTGRELIVTFRPEGQGGLRALGQGERARFWQTTLAGMNAEAGRVFADIELDLFESEHGGAMREIIKRPGVESARRGGESGGGVICSHHDFHQTPAGLHDIFDRMARTPARILKIAVLARDITDCVGVLRLFERARGEGRELIAVGMGDAGLLTRVLGPSRGGFLTYASPDAARATAPGQVTAREMHEIYRVKDVNEGTLITGLVGSPVGHSLSPHMHNAAFEARGIDAVFIPFETADVSGFVRRMASPRTRELSWNLRGMSVTAPHKSAVMPCLDRLDATASEVGAVNTVVVEGDELVGYNTDAAAALKPLGGLLKLAGARVAVIGAGGAARAVLWGLRGGGARATVFARDPERALETAKDSGAEVAAVDGASFDGYDLVVNTTPLGTRGKSEGETAATREQLRGARVAYDLVYNPAETLFLREARAAGCETAGGLAMLVAQAAAQFKLWTGLDAPADVMRAAAAGEMQRLEVRG